MEITSLCLILSATLSVLPNKSQFFRYDNITLSCAESGNSSSLTVRRILSGESRLKTSEPCSDFGDLQESSCILKDTYPSDSGLYWCESEGGKECSNIVNIIVAAGPVILESPAFPVREGDKVTLCCLYKDRYDPQPTSDFSATFFKDGVFIGTEPEGKIILPSVKKSDEGFYKCRHPTNGESAQSLLAVTVTDVPTTPPPPPPSPPPPSPPSMSLPMLVCVILLFILYVVIIIVFIYAYRRWTQVRAYYKINHHDGVYSVLDQG